MYWLIGRSGSTAPATVWRTRSRSVKMPCGAPAGSTATTELIRWRCIVSSAVRSGASTGQVTGERLTALASDRISGRSEIDSAL